MPRGSYRSQPRRVRPRATRPRGLSIGEAERLRADWKRLLARSSVSRKLYRAWHSVSNVQCTAVGGVWLSLGRRRVLARAGQPFRVPGIAVVHRIKDKFHAGRDPQLVEDSEKIFLDRVLAEVKFAGNCAIGQSFSHQGDNLFFARGQELITAGVDHAQRRHYADQIDKIVH